MSTPNSRARVILAIPFDWKHFWEEVNLPPGCRTHGAKTSAYCDECGAKIEPRVGRKAQPVFAAYCDKEGAPPEHVWEDWVGNTTLGLFGVGTKREPRLAFGTSLAILDTYDLWERGQKGEEGPTMGRLSQEWETLAVMAHKLGLDPGAARLYLTLE